MQFDLYNDIATRTGGDIYVGVVGPVRSGKSTFIKRFMDALVIDAIKDKKRPEKGLSTNCRQSGDGKSIMTTQPNFVPSEAVSVTVSDNLNVNVRMIDCVGYVVEGALGAEENGKERLVRTPWTDDEIPFAKAAEIGTEKVIKEHSTIGVVVTTDGTITDIPRDNYVPAEERVVAEMKEIGKPFVILINSAMPESSETARLKAELEKKYDAPVVVKDALNMSEDDVSEIMGAVLSEFPIKLIDVNAPRWIQALSRDNGIVKELVDILKNVGSEMFRMRDVDKIKAAFSDSQYFEIGDGASVDAGRGRIELNLKIKPELFFKVLSDECGHEIPDDFTLMSYVRFLKKAETEYSKLKNALDEVYETGYGVVSPTNDDIVVEEPEMFKQGGQYGIKIKASAPSLHLIKVDVRTEVSPIIGTEQQSGRFIDDMLDKYENDRAALLSTNVFRQNPERHDGGRTFRKNQRNARRSQNENAPHDHENRQRRQGRRAVYPFITLIKVTTNRQKLYNYATKLI